MQLTGKQAAAPTSSGEKGSFFRVGSSWLNQRSRQLLPLRPLPRLCARGAGTPGGRRGAGLGRLGETQPGRRFWEPGCLPAAGPRDDATRQSPAPPSSCCCRGAPTHLGYEAPVLRAIRLQQGASRKPWSQVGSTSGHAARVHPVFTAGAGRGQRPPNRSRAGALAAARAHTPCCRPTCTSCTSLTSSSAVVKGGAGEGGSRAEAARDEQNRRGWAAGGGRGAPPTLQPRPPPTARGAPSPAAPALPPPELGGRQACGGAGGPAAFRGLGLLGLGPGHGGHARGRAAPSPRPRRK